MLKETATPPEPALLSYGLGVNPDPLQIGTNSWLTLTVSNNTGREVVCEQIVVTLPLGTNAKDLISVGDIEPQVPLNWTNNSSGGQVILIAPTGGISVTTDGIVFTLPITVNDQPGTATITIDETTSDGVVRSTTKPAYKFPPDFTLTALTLALNTPTEIPYGEPAYLCWTATGENVTCELLYQPADSGNFTPPPPPPPNATGTGGFPTVGLTRTGDVAFTVTASYPVVGQDEPLTLSSNLTVPIQSLSLKIRVQPAIVGVGGLAQVCWCAPNADYCQTGDDQTLPASGTTYVVLQETTIFTITAYGDNQTAQLQAEIQVKAGIVPNSSIVASAAGTPGTPGVTGNTVTLTEQVPGADNPEMKPSWQVAVGSTMINATTDGSGAYIITLDGNTHEVTNADYATVLQMGAGTNGTAGTDAVLTQTLPPLDPYSDPAQVIAITVTGGNGGAGGPGGMFNAGYSWQLNGGGGGNGGNARAMISVDPTLPPAQYIVTMTAGAGGGGGPSDAMSNGPNGAPGSTAIAFNGVIFPTDGSLVAPRPFVPLALRVEVLPMVVPPNGLARLKWASPNADYCVLPDGSTAGPVGNRYIVVPASGPVTVTAYDQFGRTLAESATVTVDPSIMPTETGYSQTGGPGPAGVAGTNGSWAFSIPAGPPPTATSAGTTGQPGGSVTITQTIPPLDISGTSTQVIPFSAIGGVGGTGGTGGCLVATIGGNPTPQTLPNPQVCSPGGPGGGGGNVTIALTTDPTQSPARLIVTANPGAGGTGGVSGWTTNYDGSDATSYAPNGATGAVSVTIDGVEALLLPNTLHALESSVSRSDLIRKRDRE